MTLAAAMDAGDLLVQIPFAVDFSWTSQDYYEYAFALASQKLAETLTNYAQGALKLQPQTGTPTFAPKISKQDAFIPWEELFVSTKAASHERAIRAYFPRPLAWTLAPTANGPRRLQLLQAHLENDLLCLDQVKLEGDTPKPWTSVRQKLKL